MVTMFIQKLAGWGSEATRPLLLISLYNFVLVSGMFILAVASGNFGLKAATLALSVAILMLMLFSVAPLAFYSHRYEARWTSRPGVESRDSLELLGRVGGLVAYLWAAAPAIFFTLKIVRETMGSKG